MQDEILLQENPLWGKDTPQGTVVCEQPMVGQGHP